MAVLHSNVLKHEALSGLSINCATRYFITFAFEHVAI